MQLSDWFSLSSASESTASVGWSSTIFSSFSGSCTTSIIASIVSTGDSRDIQTYLRLLTQAILHHVIQVIPDKHHIHWTIFVKKPPALSSYMFLLLPAEYLYLFHPIYLLILFLHFLYLRLQIQIQCFHYSCALPFTST